VTCFSFGVCINRFPFGSEKLLKGLFFLKKKKKVLDYIMLTKTFPSVVMATFILQELDVSLQV
jgi:hypothetical protein